MDKIICTGCDQEVDENGYCEKDGSPFGDCCWSDHIENCEACRSQLDLTIELPCFGIVVKIADSGSSITSDLKEICRYCKNPDCEMDCSEFHRLCSLEGQKNKLMERKRFLALRASTDAIESFVLSCALSGVDIETLAFLEALETTCLDILDNSSFTENF